ncbi:MAG TPA: M56 family metallopeptidase [Polyangiaceae bacterium]|nr:M56 family metallopeptidase [Polyangiaceae bacterium]
MVDLCPCTLGLGIILAWAALPLFVKLARRGDGGDPALYYRALVSALLIATLMFVLPWLRDATDGALMEVRTWRRSWVAVDSLRVASAWVEPLVGRTPSAWPVSPVGRVLSVVAETYAVLVAIGLVRFALARARLARLCKAAWPAPDRVRIIARSLAAELGIEMPDLVVLDVINLPFTTGFFTPMVVLPQSLVARASFEQLEFVLHHELVHVARGDLRASLGIGLLRQLFAFHPAATPLLSEIALAREASVDARVAADAPLQYATFLVELAEHVRASRPLLATSLPMADAALTRRITMIISPTASPCKAEGRRAQSILLAAGAFMVAGVLLAPRSLETKAAVPVSPCPREVSGAVDGRVDRHVISKVVQDHFPAFRACYERFLDPKRTVRAEMHFTIGATGVVTGGHVDAMGAPALGSCMEPVMLRFMFPPLEGGAQTVDYPIAFAPG